MLRRSLIGMAVLVAALAGRPAAGQAQAVCERWTDRMAQMEVGTWASWRMSDGTMKQAVVGKERREGKSYFWLEIAIRGQAQGGNVVAKMLVPGWLDMMDIQEIVVQLAGQPATRVPANMMAMMRQYLQDPSEKIRAECETAVEVGPETIVVPAGTFSTVHYRTRGGTDIWVDLDLAFPLVKATTKDGDMVLAGQGTGARSAITGPVEDMLGLPGMPSF